MSTKATVAYGPNFHLYKEGSKKLNINQNNIIYLDLQLFDSPEAFKAALCHKLSLRLDINHFSGSTELIV